MIVKRDGICYVDIDYLTRYSLPPTIVLDKQVYKKGDYAKFDDPITASYFENREDTINYDDVCSLDEEGLLSKISEVENVLGELSSRWIESSEIGRQALSMNKHYMRTYKDTEYKYKELVYYRDNRESVDESINLVINDRQKVLNNPAK